MVELRSQLDSVLQSIDVREQDRVILGNFNDNPYRTTNKGKPVYPATLYQYMDFHGYRNYVTDEFRSTRMDSELSEVLDHVLVNSQAEKHVIGDKKAVPWMPLGGVAELPEWRRTYSDHFPVRIKLRVSYDDDADFQPPQPDAADLRQ
jgi:endonuclease/exonuclease/phosphatase family metal-dependent hydrolase